MELLAEPNTGDVGHEIIRVMLEGLVVLYMNDHFMGNCYTTVLSCGVYSPPQAADNCQLLSVACIGCSTAAWLPKAKLFHCSESSITLH